MKTRIKIVEYNNGRKEYVCEKNDVLPFWLMFSILGIPIYVIYLIYGNWHPIKKIDETAIDYNGQGQVCYVGAIFDNHQDAEKFMDKYIKDEEEKKIAEYQRQIKTTVYFKYR